jgi:hypothetical protein
LESVQGKRLQFTDFGTELGLEDVPANYTRVAYFLTPFRSGTKLKVVEDNFHKDKKRYDDANLFWDSVLKELINLLKQQVF